MNKLTYGTIFVLLSVACAGGILNGSFELSEPNGAPGYNPPIDWVFQNYAGVHTEFISNSSTFWSVPLAPEGANFCLLSTGDMGQNGDQAIVTSYVKQQIILEPGDTLTGSYFFGTCDWFPYVDEGRIYLEATDPNSDPNSVELVYITVEDVGNYRAMEDWGAFRYTYDRQHTGEFFLVCSVTDVGDTIVNSYLAIDNFSICRVGPNRGDLNGDCQVNMEDFVIFSNAWFCYCDPNALTDPNMSDPNSPFDPNSPCYISDINGDAFVDFDDLRTLTDWWLFPLF